MQFLAWPIYITEYLDITVPIYENKFSIYTSAELNSLLNNIHFVVKIFTGVLVGISWKVKIFKKLTIIVSSIKNLILVVKKGVQYNV